MVKKYRKVRQRITLEREIEVMACCDESALEEAPEYEVLHDIPRRTCIVGSWTIYDTDSDVVEQTYEPA